jgi:signal peptidase II
VFFDFLGISFSLNCVVNTGAAWGLFSGHATLLFFLRFCIILFLSCYVFFFAKAAFQKFAFFLLLTGAISNMVDYLLYGHVIDFFHFVFFGYSFPIFNLADSYITLGVFFLMIAPSLRTGKVFKDA